MYKTGLHFFLIVVGTSLLGVATAATDTDAWSREQAVEAARNGDLEAALRQLAILRADGDDSAVLLHDEIVVLSWAGRDREVLQNSAALDADSAPDFVAAAVARSARNAAQFEQATKWYQALLSRNAANLDARRGLAMTYADAEKFGLAWETLGKHLAGPKRGPVILLTEAYLHERQGDFLQALAKYQQASELDPENPAALRGQALMLRKLLMPRQALSLVRATPEIMSAEEIVNLEADVAAVKVRYGVTSHYPDAERFRGTDAALATIENMLAQPQLDAGVALRLRYDRIVALTNRQRAGAAIEEFQALEVDQAIIPAYVLAAAGTAYLAERQPETARNLLELAVSRDPGNFRFQFQLFFAYTDLRDTERAFSLAETLLATLPKTRQQPGSRVVKANPHYLRAAILYGLVQAYFDQLAESQAYFEDLLIKAPNNGDVRQELANVYRWRGWLDRSVFEYQQVLAIEPDLTSARVGLAHASLDSRDYSAAERELHTLRQHFDDEPNVRNLAKRWSAHNRQEVSTGIRFGSSSGPTFGNDQYDIAVSWYSKPLAHHYRLLVFSNRAFADFPESSVQRDRLGAGIEYRFKRMTATARLAAQAPGGRTGFRVDTNYRYNDWWNFGAVMDINSEATPLRAERAGTSSNVFGLGGSFRKNEGAEIGLSLNQQDFSDGNAATEISLRTYQRLLGGSRHKIFITGEAFAAKRDRDDVAYFSPKRNSSWSAGLRYKWLMARRYDFGLTHTVDIGRGQATQAGFQAGATWSAQYMLDVDVDNYISGYVSLSRRSDVYDGNREFGTFFSGGFRWKF